MSRTGQNFSQIGAGVVSLHDQHPKMEIQRATNAMPVEAAIAAGTMAITVSKPIS
jgi:hypothetical protein